MGALGLLLGPGRGLQPRAFRAPLFKLVVAAGVERQLAFAQVQDGVDRIVQKPAVVADDQRRMRVFLEPRLEPERALEVEVVGGLVQQQQLGLREQSRRERHPHAPAAGEFRHRTRQIGGGEAEPAQDFRRARGRAIGVDLDQPVVDVAQPFGLGGFELGVQRFPLHIGRQDRVQEADRRGRMLLIDRCDPGRLRHADLAAVRDQLAQDQLEQRGFSDPVAPDQADLGPDRERHARLVEKATTPRVENKIVDLKHGERRQRVRKRLREGEAAVPYRGRASDGDERCRLLGRATKLRQ